MRRVLLFVVSIVLVVGVAGWLLATRVECGKAGDVSTSPGAPVKPAKAKGAKITPLDLAPGKMAQTDYRGVELLLDGHVLEVKAEKGEYLAVVAAWTGAMGQTGWTGGPQRSEPFPLTWWKCAGGRYEVWVHVRGNTVLSLHVDRAVAVHLLGDIREVGVEKSTHKFSYSPGGPVVTEDQYVITVELENVHILK